MMDVAQPDWDYRPVGPFSFLVARESDAQLGMYIPNLPDLKAACICYLDNAAPPEQGRMAFFVDARNLCVLGYTWPIGGPMPAWVGCAAAFAEMDEIVDADMRLTVVEWELVASGHFDGLEIDG